MLMVYANKLLARGKELVNRMSESRYRNCPFNWDSLVKLYVESGEVEKADSVEADLPCRQNEAILHYVPGLCECKETTCLCLLRTDETDNVLPNKLMAVQLMANNGFRKSLISELLD
ncbi:hypothetical protein ZIOFF_018545 [Zingiber officinale]|uniref:Pentatricopeptide repeat-containing protein n=1 Tax=Zingiber officinale TaxID=94328 RepID=A0A8J5HD04_ZINOF|nr:hypothetical protein ZIOFF_018545 [Zingiber officinale]